MLPIHIISTVSSHVFKSYKSMKRIYRRQWTYINPLTIRGISLPRAMHNLHLDEPSHILIKLAHQKVHIKEVIELPAFADQWIAENVAQSDSVGVVA